MARPQQEKCHPFSVPVNMSAEIDWNEQWSLHAAGYKDGCAHIPLPDGSNFSLEPGPGFGDFSHPTTQLTLELLQKKAPQHIVFDIGCGSGILSVAAAKMGATKAFACDIDPLAEEHARKNGMRNGVDILFHPPTQPAVIVMNMIASEQKIAWKQQKRSFLYLITSGILSTEKTSYLSFAERQGWQLLETREKEGWLGCLFKELHE